MVNNDSFDSSSEGDRNHLITQSQDARDNSHSSNPVTADAAAADTCGNPDLSQTADSDLPSAIEPTTPSNSTMSVENNTKNSSAITPKNEPLEKSSVYCSLPLEKVKGALTPYVDTKADVKVKQQSSPRKLLCLYCERTFVCGNLRQKHVERCHSSKQNRRVSARRQNQLTVTPCIYCDRLNSSEHTLNDLFQHLVKEHSEKYFGCVSCEERFLNVSLRNDHNASLHQADKKKSDVVATETPPQASVVLCKLEDLVARDIHETIQRLPIKVTRSRKLNSLAGNEAEMQHSKKSAKLRDMRNKRLTVKTARIALKRSKRLQAQAKEIESQKKKRDKRLGNTHTLGLSDSAKLSEKSINPYPEFDHFYRVKKITDHSIDNLKINSLTFDDVFDKAFFNRITCNIEENLLHFIDGKLFNDEDSESRISNFEKISNAPQEVQNTSSENYGCELSLNAVTPVASLSLNSQFGEDFESQIEYGSRPSKKKPQTRRDEVHYKYFTRRKLQASILEHKENRDLSKLDMWTQLVIKKRQQKILDDKRSAKEIQEYNSGEEYKSKLRREELNRILDRRGPFEDLKEEASKKAALEKLNSSSDSSVSEETFSEVREVINYILNKVFEITTISNATEVETAITSKQCDQREVPFHLNLRRATSLPSDGEIDKSDHISLICSSQETENFELPTNRARDKHEMVELTGEWARCRMYICAACGDKLPNMKYLLEHKGMYHQNVWTQHYEFVGNQSELYRHLSIPGLGKVGLIEETVPCKLWKRSDARTCAKCGKQCNSLGELHRHILECGEDWTWMLARKKCKYRPFGAKTRRKRRGLIRRIHPKQKTDTSEKKLYKKTIVGPRQRPSDADTIQRMLANLPAKRSRRNIMSLQEALSRRKRKATNNSDRLSQNTLRKNQGRITKNSTNRQMDVSSKRRSLRSLNKVLSSRILDTNSSLMVKRKLKAFSDRRLTRRALLAEKIEKSKSAVTEIIEEEEEKEAPAVTTKVHKKTKKVSQNVAENPKPVQKGAKRSSPRITKDVISSIPNKKVLGNNLNIKSFFPVKKKKNIKVTSSETKNLENSVDVKPDENRTKRRSKENREDSVKLTENVTENIGTSKTKTIQKLANVIDGRRTRRRHAQIVDSKTHPHNEKGPKKLFTKLLKKITKTVATRNGKKDLKARDITSRPNMVRQNGNKMLNYDNQKRKLTRNFRKVIDKVKKLKLTNNVDNNVSETAPIPPSKKEQSLSSSDFLEKGNAEKENPPQLDKVVVPLERKENTAESVGPVLIVVNYADFKENPTVPETIFNLESDNEKQLQAKGELDFDKSVYSSEVEGKKTVSRNEESTDKTGPINIDVSPKTKNVPLTSPNLKGKIKKPNRGLNDCIAMLTSKLQQKEQTTNEVDTIFKVPQEDTQREATKKPLTVLKQECILRIPTFKVGDFTETAMDLSTKSPKAFSLAQNTGCPSSVLVHALDKVIENKCKEVFSATVNSNWDSVDDIIQKVINGELGHEKTAFFEKKAHWDETIEFVVNDVLNISHQKEEVSVSEPLAKGINILNNSLQKEEVSLSAPLVKNKKKVDVTKTTKPRSSVGGRGKKKNTDADLQTNSVACRPVEMPQMPTIDNEDTTEKASIIEEIVKSTLTNTEKDVEQDISVLKDMIEKTNAAKQNGEHASIIKDIIDSSSFKSGQKTAGSESVSLEEKKSTPAVKNGAFKGKRTQATSTKIKSVTKRVPKKKLGTNGIKRNNSKRIFTVSESVKVPLVELGSLTEKEKSAEICEVTPLLQTEPLPDKDATLTLESEKESEPVTSSEIKSVTKRTPTKKLAKGRSSKETSSFSENVKVPLDNPNGEGKPAEMCEATSLILAKSEKESIHGESEPVLDCKTKSVTKRIPKKKLAKERSSKETSSLSENVMVPLDNQNGEEKPAKMCEATSLILAKSEKESIHSESEPVLDCKTKSVTKRIVKKKSVAKKRSSEDNSSFSENVEASLVGLDSKTHTEEESEHVGKIPIATLAVIKDAEKESEPLKKPKKKSVTKRNQKKKLDTNVAKITNSKEISVEPVVGLNNVTHTEEEKSVEICEMQTEPMPIKDATLTLEPEKKSNHSDSEDELPLASLVKQDDLKVQNNLKNDLLPVVSFQEIVKNDGSECPVAISSHNNTEEDGSDSTEINKNSEQFLPEEQSLNSITTIASEEDATKLEDKTENQVSDKVASNEEYFENPVHVKLKTVKKRKRYKQVVFGRRPKRRVPKTMLNDKKTIAKVIYDDVVDAQSNTVLECLLPDGETTKNLESLTIDKVPVVLDINLEHADVSKSATDDLHLAIVTSKTDETKIGSSEDVPEHSNIDRKDIEQTTPNASERPDCVIPIGFTKQRARRKSKSFKKVGEVANDLFKDFALVINKKTKRIPPTNIVDDSFCDETVTVAPKLVETLSPYVSISKFSDEMLLNDSVEEMDMEIEEIAVNSTIIERDNVKDENVLSLFDVAKDEYNPRVDAKNKSKRLRRRKTVKRRGQIGLTKKRPMRRSARNQTPVHDEEVEAVELKTIRMTRNNSVHVTSKENIREESTVNPDPSTDLTSYTLNPKESFTISPKTATEETKLTVTSPKAPVKIPESEHSEQAKSLGFDNSPRSRKAKKNSWSPAKTQNSKQHTAFENHDRINDSFSKISATTSELQIVDSDKVESPILLNTEEESEQLQKQGCNLRPSVSCASIDLLSNATKEDLTFEFKNDTRKVRRSSRSLPKLSPQQPKEIAAFEKLDKAMDNLCKEPEMTEVYLTNYNSDASGIDFLSLKTDTLLEKSVEVKGSDILKEDSLSISGKRTRKARARSKKSLPKVLFQQTNENTAFEIHEETNVNLCKESENSAVPIINYNQVGPDSNLLSLETDTAEQNNVCTLPEQSVPEQLEKQEINDVLSKVSPSAPRKRTRKSRAGSKKSLSKAVFQKTKESAVFEEHCEISANKCKESEESVTPTTNCNMEESSFDFLTLPEESVASEEISKSEQLNVQEFNVNPSADISDEIEAPSLPQKKTRKSRARSKKSLPKLLIQKGDILEKHEESKVNIFEDSTATNSNTNTDMVEQTNICSLSEQPVVVSEQLTEQEVTLSLFPSQVTISDTSKIVSKFVSRKRTRKKKVAANKTASKLLYQKSSNTAFEKHEETRDNLCKESELSAIPDTSESKITEEKSLSNISPSPDLSVSAPVSKRKSRSPAKKSPLKLLLQQTSENTGFGKRDDPEKEDPEKESAAPVTNYNEVNATKGELNLSSTSLIDISKEDLLLASEKRVKKMRRSARSLPKLPYQTVENSGFEKQDEDKQSTVSDDEFKLRPSESTSSIDVMSDVSKEDSPSLFGKRTRKMRRSARSLPKILPQQTFENTVPEKSDQNKDNPCKDLEKSAVLENNHKMCTTPEPSVTVGEFEPLKEHEFAVINDLPSISRKKARKLKGNLKSLTQKLKQKSIEESKDVQQPTVVVTDRLKESNLFSSSNTEEERNLCISIKLPVEIDVSAPIAILEASPSASAVTTKKSTNSKNTLSKEITTFKNDSDTVDSTCKLSIAILEDALSSNPKKTVSQEITTFKNDVDTVDSTCKLSDQTTKTVNNDNDINKIEPFSNFNLPIPDTTVLNDKDSAEWINASDMHHKQVKPSRKQKRRRGGVAKKRVRCWQQEKVQTTSATECMETITESLPTSQEVTSKNNSAVSSNFGKSDLSVNLSNESEDIRKDPTDGDMLKTNQEKVHQIQIEPQLTESISNKHTGPELLQTDSLMSDMFGESTTSTEKVQLVNSKPLENCFQTRSVADIFGLSDKYTFKEPLAVNSSLDHNLEIEALRTVLGSLKKSGKKRGCKIPELMLPEIEPLTQILTNSDMDIAPVIDEIDKSLEIDDIYDFADNLEQLDMDHNVSRKKVKKKERKKKYNPTENLISEFNSKSIDVPDISLLSNLIDASKGNDRTQESEKLNNRKSSSRSAKIKALENIHDDALFELPEVPNINVDIKKKLPKNKKKKTQKESTNVTHINSDVQINDVPLTSVTSENVPQENQIDADVIPSFENTEPGCLVEQKNLDQTFNNVSTEILDSSLNKLEVLNESTGKELRRSRRVLPKVASYNENDLIDPLIDALEKKRQSIKKDKSVEKPTDGTVVASAKTKLPEPQEKLNSDELFDLLKISTNENDNMFMMKTQNSFLNNLDESNSTRDFNDFDNVFENILEKSTLLIRSSSLIAEKDADVYEFTVSSPESPEPLRDFIETQANTKAIGVSETEECSIPLGSALNSSLGGLLSIPPTPTPDTKDSEKVTKSKDTISEVPDKSNYCEICNKYFIRIENLVKHRRTLTHISKLSEIEAKEAAEKAKQNEVQQTIEISDSSLKTVDALREEIDITDILQQSENFQVTSKVQTTFESNNSLKLADIINDVLNKPVLDGLQSEKVNNFSDIILQTTTVDSQPEFRRCKSLGERKSFECDKRVAATTEPVPNNNNYFHGTESKTTILEKQISLLENIIENQAGPINSYIDEISLSSCNSPPDLENSSDSKVAEVTEDKETSEDKFLKPTQYEEISEDSTNVRNYEDQKLRKTLNRDEELFLECCSLLKSSSEISKFAKKSKALKNMDLKQSDEADWLENKSLVQTVEEAHEFSDNSRTPTPLGDTFDDEASNSNTISSNWELKKGKEFEIGKRKSFSFDDEKSIQRIFESTSDNKISSFGEIISSSIKNQTSTDSTSEDSSTDDETIPSPATKSSDKDDSDCSVSGYKNIVTKGARKVFEGLKVSIPTVELNLDEVLNLNHTPNTKKVNDHNKTEVEETVTTPTKPPRKSRPTKNAKVESNILFKKNKNWAFSKTSDDKEDHDIYDFEETQDNMEVFTKPDFKTFRNKKLDTSKEESDSESKAVIDSSIVESQSTSSISSVSVKSVQKTTPPENVTKKKCMIMGRIFKNAVKSKDEDIRTIPEIDNIELVESYVLSCAEHVQNNAVSEKPKMTEKEMNILFDKLVGKPTTKTPESKAKPNSKPKPIADVKKKVKAKNRKRTRGNSDSSDDEFNINKTTRKRPSKKHAKEEDNCINLEQELRECIGVASRKSQRKCTSGKQNVLVEYWSSDEEAFEALLENKKIPHALEDLPLPPTSKADTKQVPAVLSEATESLSTALGKEIELELLGEKPLNKKNVPKKKLSGNKRPKLPHNDSSTANQNRRKRAAAHPLYHWSSSSEDESHNLIEVKPIREDEVDYDEDRPVQHGWIVGDSPKKLVTMLALTKGKKSDADCVKEQGKKRTTAVS